MKRRDFSLATLSTAAAVGGLAWSAPAFAQGPAKFVAGKDYLKLDRVVPTDAEAGKIQLIEFFWYSCPHCNAFEPAFAQWVKNAPKTLKEQREELEKKNSAAVYPSKEAIRAEYIKDRMSFYGPGHFYFEAKGKYYFVTNPKDLDNEKKWRVVR